MKKALLQLTVTVALFFGTWFALSKINWMSVFKIEKLTKSTEEKLGELLWELTSQTETEIHSPSIAGPVDSLINHICEKNSIDRDKIKVHVVRKDEINAFAFPDNHLVVYTGLIEACENEEELSGILGHEIAHMQKNHVMKKLIKEIGLSVLISMTAGNGGGEVIKETAKLLSSSAYDRTLESEADITAVDYLLKAEMDPEPFANFLYRLSNEEENIPKQIFWISTHPESKERAEAIIEYFKEKKVVKKKVLAEGKWEALKERIKETE